MCIPNIYHNACHKLLLNEKALLKLDYFYSYRRNMDTTLKYVLLKHYVDVTINVNILGVENFMN